MKSGVALIQIFQHTVPARETTIVPYKVPNSNPADIVKGTAGMAST